MGRPLSINLITLLKSPVPQFPSDSRISLKLEPCPLRAQIAKTQYPSTLGLPKHRYLSPGPPDPRLAFLRSGGPKKHGARVPQAWDLPRAPACVCPRTRVPQTSRAHKARGSPDPRARSSQTPGVWYFRPGTPRLPRTRVPQTRGPLEPGRTSLSGPGRLLPHPPHPPPGISPARPHPGRPVRVALHLGKHQVPGLEGVRHAGGGKPRPREAAVAAAAAAVEAAAGGEAGGGSRERRGRRRSLGQRPARAYWTARCRRMSHLPAVTGGRQGRSEPRAGIEERRDQ